MIEFLFFKDLIIERDIRRNERKKSIITDFEFKYYIDKDRLNVIDLRGNKVREYSLDKSYSYGLNYFNKLIDIKIKRIKEGYLVIREWI